MNIKVIDNFLEKKDFDQIVSIKLSRTDRDKIKVYHNMIDKNENIKVECLNSELLKKLHHNYHTKAMNLLKELNPLKAELYDYSEFHIIETGADYEFPIHDDTPDKLLSGVVYLKPEENTGTIFYENRNGDGKNIVEWKMNRGVFFQEAKKKLGILIKEMGKIIELHWYII